MLLFLFAVIVISFSEKKKQTEFLLAAVLFITAAVLFKTYFLLELGIGLLFPEGKRRSEQEPYPIEAKFHCFLRFLGSFSFLA